MQRELIEKYFSNECSEEERRQVLEYFKNNPAEWNKYVNEEDWDNFKVNDELDPGVTERLYQQVSEQTFNKRRMKPVYWMAAAAAIVAGIMALLWNTDIRQQQVRIPLSAQLSESRNDSDTILRIRLEDGSVVLLSPHSRIQYDAHFATRAVYLSGKGLFQVGHFKEQPFIVYADRLVTTVLGTSFTVESFRESAVVKVKLHNGKVQVAPASDVHTKWNGKEILKPGDELIYDKGTMLASVSRYTPARKLVKAGPADHTDRNVRRPDIYTFDMSPLSDVFEQLSVYYQVDIYYYPSDVQNKYFSGRMRKTDTLATILKDIGILNQLKIEKQEQHYIISKKN